MPFKCDICGGEFKTKQALASHKFYTHEAGKTPKDIAEETEKMLDFFNLLEKGESPVQAILKVGANPEQAERWTRIYERLVGRGVGSKIEELEGTITELKKLIMKIEKDIDKIYESMEELFKVIQVHDKEIELITETLKKRL